MSSVSEKLHYGADGNYPDEETRFRPTTDVEERCIGLLLAMHNSIRPIGGGWSPKIAELLADLGVIEAPKPPKPPKPAA
jgi:hypothetical protein